MACVVTIQDVLYLYMPGRKVKRPVLKTHFTEFTPEDFFYFFSIGLQMV